VDNTDRAQLAAIKVADVAIDGALGVAQIALTAALQAEGVPAPVAAEIAAQAVTYARKKAREATAPTVKAQGFESDLPRVP